MGEIKSAFEIAMENVKDVVGDKESVKEKKFTDMGKKIASEYLNDSMDNIKDEIAKYKGKEKEWVLKGMVDTLLANLVLPSDEYGLGRNRKVGEALFVVLKKPERLGNIMSELEHFFKEYLEERKRLMDAIERQYAPKLRQKEEELSRQMGAPVKIDPSSDPEYTAFVRRNMGQLEERYREVLNRVKEEVRSYLN